MGQYFVTTLYNAIIKIGPLIAFAIGGYLIFVKLPFLFLKKSMKEQKEKLDEESKHLKVVQEKYTVEDYKEFQRKMKLMNGEAPDRSKVVSLPDPAAKKQERKTEQKKTEQKREEPKRPRPATPQGPSDEEILGLKPGETFTMSELKKRYIERIRQNHPDKVASMGPDFKKLAEKNTKEINKAFDKLKKKAS